MSRQSHVTALLLMLSANLAAAGQLGTPENEHTVITQLESVLSSMLVTIAGGPVWTRDAGSMQNLFLTPAIEKGYVARPASEGLLEGEIFLASRTSLPKGVEAQGGVAVMVTGNANLSGNIWDDTDARFNNYVYQYKVQHTHVALRGKLLSERDISGLRPWVS